MSEETNRGGYKQAAEWLGLKIGTLYSLVSRKQVPHVRISGRLVIFDRAELERWMSRKSVKCQEVSNVD